MDGSFQISSSVTYGGTYVRKPLCPLPGRYAKLGACNNLNLVRPEQRYSQKISDWTSAENHDIPVPCGVRVSFASITAVNPSLQHASSLGTGWVLVGRMTPIRHCDGSARTIDRPRCERDGRCRLSLRSLPAKLRPVRLRTTIVNIPLMNRNLLLILVLFCLASPARAEFVLVDVGAGVEPAPLLLFANAPPKTRDAAIELANYIEKICGVRSRLMDGTPNDLPERAIWVGYEPALDSLFPRTDFDFQHPEEIVIAAWQPRPWQTGRRWNASAKSTPTRSTGAPSIPPRRG